MKLHNVEDGTESVTNSAKSDTRDEDFTQHTANHNYYKMDDSKSNN